MPRVDTAINEPGDFRVYRPKQGEPEEKLAWRPVRWGAADQHRRAEVAQKANQCRLNALASPDDSTTLEELTDGLVQSTRWNGRRVRGLCLWESDDNRLLAAIGRGEFTINGLRNRDRQRLLDDRPAGFRAFCAPMAGCGKCRVRTAVRSPFAPRKALTAILAARSATVAQLSKAA